LDLAWPLDNSGDSVASNDEDATPHTSFDVEKLQEFGNHCEEEKSNASPSASSTASAIANNAPITEHHAIEWREKICKWVYQVADHFDLTRDIVYITMNYMDRICAASNVTELLQDKNLFQLLAMAALCVAIKIHGELDTSVPWAESSILHTIVYLSQSHFTANDLEIMEMSALQRMQWHLHPPTPQLFVSYFIELYPTEEKIELKDIALYFVELSVHDYYFVSFKPSVIALAALSNAACIFGRSESLISDIQEDLFRHNGYREEAKIDACRVRLEKLFANTGTEVEDFVGVPSPMALGINDHLKEKTRDCSPASIIN